MFPKVILIPSLTDLMIITANINMKGELQITKIPKKPKVPIEFVGLKLQRKGVLILGSYSDDGKKIIHRFAEILNDKNYFPISTRRYQRWWGQTPRHWLSNLTALVRFVIAEDSYPSGE